MNKIILTGGGSAGHVTPNMALVPTLRNAGYDILYIGSHQGIEKNIVSDEGIPYRSISSGKLRRYFDLKNCTDPFRVIKGYFDAKKILKEYKPDIVFSKGGFVSVPVVVAASYLHIPVIIHESDMTPGLANKISMRYASKICCNFPETVRYLPQDKAVLTGTPIRAALFDGSKAKGLSYTKLSDDKPILLVIGGSLGAVAINDAVRSALPDLLSTFNIIHLCGKGHLDLSLNNTKGYAQFEYISEQMPDIFAMTDIVISRAGANAIAELLALKKPNILIPLPATQSRGDQILNAKSFVSSGYSYLLPEEELTSDKLVLAVKGVYKDRDKYIHAMDMTPVSDGVKAITELIFSTVHNH